jgi:predicted choloylglycine hydrolase
MPWIISGCFLLVALTSAPARAAEPFRYPEGKSGKAELKYVNGLPVLTVEGTPAEIGTQTGKLCKEPLKKLTGFSKELLRELGFEKRWPQLVEVSNAMVPQFPADHLKELEAIIKQGGLDREQAIVGNTFADISKIASCSALLVEPRRSATGSPLFGRNLDYPTAGFLHKYSLVIVYRPKGKHAFASIGFPGLVGVLSGMNDAGLAIATLEVHTCKDGSVKFDPKGVPYTLGYRRILEECTTIAEAEKLLRSIKRTTRNNLAVCDKKGVAIIEITPRNVIVRRGEDGFCPCTNHFRTDKLATSKKCPRYDALCKCQGMDKLDRAAVAKLLHAASVDSTLQTMIFEPATLKLYLAIGKCPSSALPMKELELGSYFKSKN